MSEDPPVRRLRVGHYYPRLLREQSGVTAAVDAWADALEAAGHTSVRLADSRDVTTAHAYATTRGVSHLGNRRATFIPLDLQRHVRDLDLVYLHEGWTTSNVVAAEACRRARVPYVVMPHGVYEPGIVETLKRPAALRRQLEARVLARALAVHVYFDTEGELARAVAPTARVLVAPTGTELPAATWTGEGGYVAWFGRFEPRHKGLDLLVRAVGQLDPPDRPQVRLRGYDYQGGREEVRHLVQQLGLDDWVQVGEEVRGEEKERFLQLAGAYVHPSRWESHSIALVEVLGRGVPTAVSGSIHIAAPLARAGAALATDPTEAAWARTLVAPELLANAALGAAGREFVRTQLAWPVVVAALEVALSGLDL